MAILQLKIQLRDLRPTIWRRILINDSISLHQFHKIIQIVMGWDSYHLWEFKIGEDIISAPDEGGFNPAEGALDKLIGSPEFMKAFQKKEKAIEKGELVSLNMIELNKILLTTNKENKTKSPFNINTPLNKLISKEKAKFLYRYDFGDNWMHVITVEKIMDEDSSRECPVCIAGERACPPEDCGGIWGYEELLKIQKDKNHQDYEERIIEWLGEDFNFEHFDLDKINKRLK